MSKLYLTAGVNNRAAEDPRFAKFVLDSIKRHCRGDWGDLSEDDKKENDYALDKNLRLFSSPIS